MCTFHPHMPPPPPPPPKVADLDDIQDVNGQVGQLKRASWQDSTITSQPSLPLTQTSNVAAQGTLLGD